MSQRLLVLVGALAAAGCSTSTNTYVESKCGPGTVLVDGVCEAAGSDGGVASDSSVAWDATTGLPDGSTETSDGAPEAAVGSSDPCPTGKIGINCSKTCGGPTANCIQAACHVAPDGGFIPLLTINGETQLPLVVRTPEKPEVDPLCGTGCMETPNIVYGIAVKVDYPGTYFHLTVEPPWTVGPAGLFSAYCDDRSAKTRCYAGYGAGVLLISTRDPNAPSRNVIIEKGDVSCP